MNTSYAVISVAIISAVTLLLRALPFAIFSGNKKTPKTILYLGRVLPYAIMGMLVVYCLKSINITSAPFVLPEIIASGAVVILHLWKRNTLISIVAGTLIYMFLVQFVF